MPLTKSLYTGSWGLEKKKKKKREENVTFKRLCLKAVSALTNVPKGSHSRSGDVAFYVHGINQPSLLTPFVLFCSCVCFCLHGPFDCISFHKVSRQLSVFSLCSFGLLSALLVLSTICLFVKVSFSPDIIPCG